MYCTNCGKEIEKADLFCGQCGAKQPLITPNEAKQEEKNVTAAPAVNIEKETLVIANKPVEERQPEVVGGTQTDKNNMPGRKMLKVVGIISVVVGALTLIGSLEELDFSLSLWYETYLTVANIVLGGLMLTMGILGIVWCAKKEKAGALVMLSIIMLALLPITIILGIIEGNERLVDAGIETILFIAALPILFLIGALKRKNSPV